MRQRDRLDSAWEVLLVVCISSICLWLVVMYTLSQLDKHEKAIAKLQQQTNVEPKQ